MCFSAYIKAIDVTCVVNNPRTNVVNNPSSPIDNQIAIYLTFFDKLIRYLEFNAMQSTVSLSERDKARLRNVIIRVSYMTVLFDQMIDEGDDRIDERSDFSKPVSKIVNLMSADVHESRNRPISMSKVVELDFILQKMIETHYFNQVDRPWWKFWG